MLEEGAYSERRRREERCRKWIPKKGIHVTEMQKVCQHYFLPVITRLHLSPIEKESLWKTQFLGNGEILREMSCRDMEKKTPESRKCGNAEMRG